ncbi:GH3 auxin-responsive promoter family protein [Aquidulcibacter sp.]|jgi:hypothetical protein|uniref:GH3 auxin-responsive promoter family protein n=1 Tax=Aquidulcibacter sp. TaxID=2052990 RepID=UPI0037BF7DAE
MLQEFLARAALWASMETLGRSAHRKLLSAAKDPRSAQESAMREIVRLCVPTGQGQRFGLAHVDGVDAFRAAVPIQTYEDIRPAIEHEIQSGALEIAPEPPLMYARTSGTTGKQKYIPVTPTTLRQSQTAQRAMAYAPHAALRAFSGKVLGLGGAATEERLSRNVAAGATSGLIYQTMPGIVRANYVVPAQVFGIEDYALKYLLIARLALAQSDLSLIATANPSTILRLLAVIDDNRQALAADLLCGGFHASDRLDAGVRHAIAPLLRPAPIPGQRLAAALPIRLSTLWPNLRAVVTWLGGGCAIAAQAVRAQLPPQGQMMDAGYVASELRGTVVVDVTRGLALPMLRDVFFEFVPVNDWDAGVRETRLLHELEYGQDYHIIVTTAAGLLRYHMNDVMRVTGRVGATPTLAFIRKGRGVTNIVGEKLSEDQVHAAVVACLPEPPRFYVALADTADARYFLWVEPANSTVLSTDLAASIDAKLAHLNIEYAAKRGSGRLHPLQVRVLRRDAGEAYHRHLVEHKGQREAQAKVLALQTVEEFDFNLSAFEIVDAVA